jgi:hypothetical protein
MIGTKLGIVAFTVTTLLAGMSGTGDAASPIEITTCGQVVAGGKAILTVDLDCSGPDHAIIIEGPTKLDLNGHSVKAGPNRRGVLCLSECKIVGPGTISDSGIGIGMTSGSVDSVTITNCGLGIEVEHSGTGHIKVRNSTIELNAAQGIISERYAKVYSSTIANNGGNGVEVRTQAGAGTCVGFVYLKDSSVSGNGGTAPCGVDVECADLASCKRPKVRDGSSCGTSLDLSADPATASWGVCSQD